MEDGLFCMKWDSAIKNGYFQTPRQMSYIDRIVGHQIGWIARCLSWESVDMCVVVEKVLIFFFRQKTLKCALEGGA